MRDARKILFYCDDQPEFIEKFKARHDDEYEIHGSTDITKAKGEVLSLIHQGRKPDIILLDLYHPRECPNFEANRRTAETKLEELRQKIEEIRPYINRTWMPEGISALEELRTLKELSAVPILFYTQRGLLFMSDDQLQTIYDKDSDWMLKDRENSSNIAERARINQLIRRNAERHHWFKIYVVPAITFASGLLLAFANSLISAIFGAPILKLLGF